MHLDFNMRGASHAGDFYHNRWGEASADDQRVILDDPAGDIPLRTSQAQPGTGLQGLPYTLHSGTILARNGRKNQASLICLGKHRSSSRSIAAFPSYLSHDLGLALMNLELHGCAGISAANELCELGLVSPVTFVTPRNHAGALAFEAIEMDLQAVLEINRILMASATKHPFIAEAFARMQIDQFATEEHVVFDQGFLSQCGLEMHEIAFARSARNWRRQDAAVFRNPPG